jgi:hypothetical protein
MIGHLIIKHPRLFYLLFRKPLFKVKTSLSELIYLKSLFVYSQDHLQ